MTTHADTLDRVLRLLARVRRCLDHMADKDRPFIFRDLDAAVARELAAEIVQLIGHSITDQPEADEMFALRELLGEVTDIRVHVTSDPTCVLRALNIKHPTADRGLACPICRPDMAE